MSIKCLIVDDELSEMEEFANLLHQIKGFEVVGKLHSGFDTLEAIDALEPDLVFLEIQILEITPISFFKKMTFFGRISTS